MRICSVEGCNNKHHAKGYCQRHYNHIITCGHVLERTRADKNEIVEHDDYAEIILYDKQHNETARAIIDLECIEVVRKYKWHLSHGYVYNNRVGPLHRYLMNPADNLVIDHINRNPLDNRRDNLRACTQHENIFNKSIQCNNTSGVPGVCWDKTKNRWIAYIKFNNKQKRLGQFKTKEEAIEARRRAEIEYFGEYAPTNN